MNSNESTPTGASAEMQRSSDQPPTTDLASTGSLEKIRDILFGAQARDYERRFSRLEDRIIKETFDLRDEMKKRFDSLESFIRKELELINSRLLAERDEREKANLDLSQVVTELARSFEKRAAQLDQQMASDSKEIREQMLAQYKSLMDEILQKHKEISNSLEREARELRLDKVDRFALASMLGEVSMRLNNDLVIPIPEDTGDE
jgi:hypothetical protein